jgi:hypothetical protein
MSRRQPLRRPGSEGTVEANKPPQPQVLGSRRYPGHPVPNSPPYRAPGLRVHDTQAAVDHKPGLLPSGLRSATSSTPWVALARLFRRCCQQHLHAISLKVCQMSHSCCTGGRQPPCWLPLARPNTCKVVPLQAACGLQHACTWREFQAHAGWVTSIRLPNASYLSACARAFLCRADSLLQTLVTHALLVVVD